MAALLASTNRLGWRRPVRAARRRSPALEGGDTAVVKLRALKRPAFLRDALLAERGIRAQEPLVLLALAEILLAALAGRRGEGDWRRSSQRRRDSPEPVSAWSCSPCGWTR